MSFKIAAALKSGTLLSKLITPDNMFEVINVAKGSLGIPEIFKELNKKSCKLNTFQKLNVLNTCLQVTDNHYIINDYIINQDAEGKKSFNLSTDLNFTILKLELMRLGVFEFIDKYSTVSVESMTIFLKQIDSDNHIEEFFNLNTTMHSNPYVTFYMMNKNAEVVD